MELQPFEVRDFKGGITDYHLNGNPTKYLRADNFLIVKQETMGKLFTRPGSVIWDAANPQTPAGNQRIGTMYDFQGTLLVHSARKFYYINAGAWVTLVGPTGNQVFPAGVTVNNVLALKEQNKTLFVSNDAFTKVQKIYKDDTGTLQLRTAGMPFLASSPTVTPSVVGVNNYLYRFFYKYNYKVGNLTFSDFGPTTEVAVSSSDDPGTNPNGITTIPVLANGTTDNYDTASADLTVEIYRTVNNETAFFRVGSVPNGTTVFSDNVSDATIENNQPLYTEGGIPDNDPPPLAKYIHTTETFCYYAHTKNGSEINLNRIYQSAPGDPDSVPAENFLDLDDEIVGISSVRNIPIVCCANGAVYRIDGAFDLQGRGGMTAQKISDTAVCASNQGMVQTLDINYFFAVDGVYQTDGFSVMRVNREWNVTHAAILDDSGSKGQSRKRIQGKYDKKNRRIWWTVWFDGTSGDNDQCYILDLNFGVSDDMPFTATMLSTYFKPTAIEFKNDNLIRGDARGYIFEHKSSVYTDPKIDTFVAPSSWLTATIFYGYVSCANNFGTDYVRKFGPRITVYSKNETNLSLQIVSNNDDGKSLANLAPIRFRGNITWGDPDVYWGDPHLVWNQGGLIDAWRRFPAKNMRFSYKQIQLQNAFVAIVNSDLLGTAVIDGVGKTATLTNAVQIDWPSQSVDNYLAFENDGYVAQYLITARTDDVLTFSDPGGASPFGTQQWVLRGYPRGEVLNLLSYVVPVAAFGRTQEAFHTSDSGEVGT